MNPRALAEDPIIAEISDNLSNHWATYRSVFSDPKPLTLFRAVALEVIAQAQEEDVGIAVALFNLAANVLPLLDLGHEQEIWTKLIDRARGMIEPHLNAEWSDDEITSAPLAPPKTEKPGKVDRKNLLALIESAVGPSNQAGESLKDPNPQWPNAGQAWAHAFAPRMASAIATHVDSLAENIAKADAALTNTVSTLVSSSAKAMRATQMRVSLLWWRHSLFSPTAQIGYRAMPPVNAAAQMAIDVYKELPIYHTASIEHFLREAVAAVVGDSRAKSADTFLQTIEEFKKGPSSSSIVELSASVTTARRPLISVLSDTAPYKAGEIEICLGFSDQQKIGLGDFAAWILRELQARDSVQ